MRLTVVALLLAWAAVLPRPASADWVVGPLIGFSFAGETNLVDLDFAAGDTKIVYGGTGGWIGDGLLGIEADVAYLPGFFQRDEEASLVRASRVLTLMGNVVVAVPRRWTEYSLRPYVSGGVGLMRATIEDVSNVFPVDYNLFGLNVGGGATGFVNERVGLRWELRYFKNIPDGDDDQLSFGTTRLSFWRASMAVVFRN